MKLFYHPESGRMGDIIPYFEDGVFRLFYLGNGWSNVSTTDQLHFADEFSTSIRGGTGSVVKVDGTYHMFYCKFTDSPYPRQYSCHAVSTDFREWTEIPEDTFQPDDVIYEMSDWRDPHVVWNEEERCWWMLIAAQKKGRTMRKGCVGLCKSDDLKHWRYCEPVYAPSTNQSASECPDLFRWGDWWYLTYSVYTDRFETLYRMARSPMGPWITPKRDTFDTRCFYAAKHGTDGTDHFMYGWNPDREKNIWDFSPGKDYGKDYQTWDWGGTMIVHQLVQNEDKTLGVKAPEQFDSYFTIDKLIHAVAKEGDVKIDGNNISLSAEPGSYALADMGTRPATMTLECDVTLDEDGCVGFAFGGSAADPTYTALCLDAKLGNLHYEGYEITDLDSLDPMSRTRFDFSKNSVHHVKLVCENEIVVMYVDDMKALSSRIFHSTDGAHICVFANGCSASFTNISMKIAG